VGVSFAFSAVVVDPGRVPGDHGFRWVGVESGSKPERKLDGRGSGEGEGAPRWHVEYGAV
jgi:hypothetical protein